MNIFEILGPVSYNLLHSTLPYFALLFFAMRCYLQSTLPTPPPLNFILHPSLLVLLYSAMLCSALLYETPLSSALLCSTSL